MLKEVRATSVCLVLSHSSLATLLSFIRGPPVDIPSQKIHNRVVHKQQSLVQDLQKDDIDGFVFRSQDMLTEEAGKVESNPDELSELRR